MGVETWVVLGVEVVVVAVAIPSVAWLIREIMDMRVRIVTLERDLAAMQTNCVNHHAWQEDISKKLERTDRNMARVCQALKVVEYESEG